MGWVNTLRPRQNGRHFADDIFKRFFLNENVWIPIKISLKFVPKDPIDNIPALVQIMAWRRPGASHYLKQWWLDYWRIYTSLGLNELKSWSLKIPTIYWRLWHRQSNYDLCQCSVEQFLSRTCGSCALTYLWHIIGAYKQQLIMV